MTRILAALLLVAFTVPALSHGDADWIRQGGFKGKGQAAGEWCCGEVDCFVIQSKDVKATADGYEIYGREIIPYSETQPSPDGQYWRCKRPDGSRRCFFAPPPGS